MEWPRDPLPGWPDVGDTDAADMFARSTKRGRELAALLDPDTLVPGITEAPHRLKSNAVTVSTTADSCNVVGEDFALIVDWGHIGIGGAVMPGQGHATERAYAPEERAILGAALSALGETMFDVHLNDRAFWCSILANVWRYRLGGYHIFKKWLSYRERSILSRPLSRRSSVLL